jgi:protein-tyrosine phosphatase
VRIAVHFNHPTSSRNHHQDHAVTAKISQVLDINYGTFRGWVRSLLGQLEYVTGRLNPHLQPSVPTVQRLVFVCLGNINRSAFAAEVARSRQATVHSIGLSTTTGAPAFHTAVSTASRLGYDLSAHTATDLSDYAYQTGDLLLVMEVRHIGRLIASGIPAHAITPLGQWASPVRIHLHDPHTLSDEYFRTCFNLINSAVINLTEDFRALNSPCMMR